MLYSLAFTFLAYVVRQSFAILPPNYESLDAQEKQNILWSQISANPYFLDKLPTAFPQYPWVNLSQLMNVSYVRVIFERYSDEMPIGRVKITTPYGVAARFRWVPFPNTSAGYTGLYKSTALGIVRLSIVNWKQFAPQIGLKFLVDGKHSRTMLGFKGVADRPSRNFFDGPFSDIFTSNSDSGSAPPAFIASIAALDGGPNDRPEGPNSLSPYELGEIDPDGTSVGDKVVSPFHVEMRVPDELFNKISPDSKNDFRADIIDAAPAGTLLFTVWGQAGPGAAFEPLGQIYTISNFVASKYADEVLFFRHPHKRWVPPSIILATMDIISKLTWASPPELPHTLYNIRLFLPAIL